MWSSYSRILIKLTRSAVELPVLASYSTGEVAAVITTGLLAATGGFTYRVQTIAFPLNTFLKMAELSTGLENVNNLYT